MKKTCLRLKKSLKRCLDPNQISMLLDAVDGPETPDAEALVVVAGVDIGIRERCPRGKK